MRIERFCSVGYRVDDADLPEISETKQIKLEYYDPRPTAWRAPVKVSLGPHTSGSLPHVDPDHVETLHAGINKRVAYLPPTPLPGIWRKLRRFVLKWCQQNLDPLSHDGDYSLETWLAGTDYSQARKKELLEKWVRCNGILLKKHFRVKSFVKDESYTEWKHARGINSRTDEFKCATGPIFHAIEQVIFQHPAFIKYTPVPLRPNYIMENVYVEGATYVATDYTAFESHFVAELMHSCEFVMYKYMTQFIPDATQFTYYLDHVIAGLNNIRFKNIKMQIHATRMSGEMCTSLGNGFSNLMFSLFIGKRLGNDIRKIRGIVEGDDGLFYYPTRNPTEEDFRDLGLTIKLEVVDDIQQASFCGIVFDATASVNIADPIKIVCQLGWTNANYLRSKNKVLRGLLKSKAYSLLYQYPGCPIVHSLAKSLLRQLQDDYVYFRKGSHDYKDILAKKAFDWVMKHEEVLLKEPLMSTRILMERKFGIAITDQLSMESYFDSFDCTKAIECGELEHYIPDPWLEYYRRYTLWINLTLTHKEAFQY